MKHGVKRRESTNELCRDTLPQKTYYFILLNALDFLGQNHIPDCDLIPLPN